MMQQSQPPPRPPASAAASTSVSSLRGSLMTAAMGTMNTTNSINSMMQQPQLQSLAVEVPLLVSAAAELAASASTTIRGQGPHRHHQQQHHHDHYQQQQQTRAPASSTSTAPSPFVREPNGDASRTVQPSSQPQRQYQTQEPVGRIPAEFLCPILGTIMSCPVTSSSTGLHYEQTALVLWGLLGGTACPLTGLPFGQLVPNTGLLLRIIAWTASQAELIRQQQQQQNIATPDHCMLGQQPLQQATTTTTTATPSAATSIGTGNGTNASASVVPWLPNLAPHQQQQHGAPGNPPPSTAVTSPDQGEVVDKDVMAAYDKVAIELVRAHTSFRIEQKAKADEENDAYERTGNHHDGPTKRKQRAAADPNAVAATNSPEKEPSIQRRKRRRNIGFARQHRSIFKTGP
eukprot:CAMPEP_0119564358 /NCGR_PEP_ID=MMETSP1352-20130426/26740_1 /TAXON_ID=265584 /ORGANISM="Stauroneis constricta, Strain CCMP1120" /LENGTH=402 /DNA_ID=CAMNT_0007613111 /DNA_START=70 /DNA_END=1275 /DNA_ORIENTATION=+